jgi:osmotically-inducible protein OsmY
MAAAVSDRDVMKQVAQRLATRGLSSACKIDVQSKNGEVTLTGNIQFAHQRVAAMQAAGTASGVQHVVDRLTLKAVDKRH